MLYEEKKQMHPAKKMLFLLIPLLLIAAAYGVYDFSLPSLSISLILQTEGISPNTPLVVSSGF